MTSALILAAGVDPSFNMDIPKQFVIVDNIPVIVYTLKIFQEHPEIDRIVVSCLSGWEEMVRAYAKQFGVDKCEEVIIGGANAQKSIRNGVNWLFDNGKEDDLVVIHDAIRPLVSAELISDSIRVCKKYGMGVAAIRSMDTIMLSDSETEGEKSISRTSVKRIQTPQTYRLGYLKCIHDKAVEKGAEGFVDNNSVVTALGEKVYFSKGSDLNIKINAVEDIEMFKALYRMKANT